MKNPLKIMIVAGEASADVYGSLLAKEILKSRPSTLFFGFGGGHMARAGVKIAYPLVDLAVMGWVAVFKNIRTFRYLLKLSHQMLRSEQPDAVVLIDYPGFNLRVAEQAKKLGIPVIYYISPQVWAWRPKRIHRIAELVTKMLVVLPFEKALYEKVNCPVEFVGHPLLDVVKDIRKAKKPSHKALVTLLPGSRKEEIERLLPTMLKVAERLTAYEPIDFVLPLASTITRYMVDGHLSRSKVFVKVITKDTLAMRKAADFALVASGTATLETALMQIPMVILYKVSPVNYWIAKRVVNVSYIGLVNIVAGKRIVPEFLQEQVQPELILPQALALLQDTEQRAQMKKDLRTVAVSLGEGGASRLAAIAVLKVIEQKRI